ncbi:MAG: YheT family hydrolase [Candidatus Promineifilaceae bacterium]|jgi:predicted alpha/beta-fold hydrolase
MPADFNLEAFNPSPLWRHPHVQTVLANTLRPTSGAAFHRLRLDTPDGDFLDLDFSSVDGVSLPDSAPLVLLLHGLEGSARSSYAYEAYRQLAARGIRAVGMNFRSCSGEMNRTATLYHAGKTDDVDLVVNWLLENQPGVPLGMIGFSLGANMLLKYLGEKGSQSAVRAAVAVSPPFDLGRTADTFEHGEGRLYGLRFMRDLQKKALLLAKRNGNALDIERILTVKSMREFDEAFTAPLHGFRDAEEYYALNSSGRFVRAIGVPTLVIRALDDPMFVHDVPHAALAGNEHITPALTPYGGHVAFAEGRYPRKFRYWAERQAARYLAVHLIE